MPISSLANTNGKGNSNSRRRKMKTKKALKYCMILLFYVARKP